MFVKGSIPGPIDGFVKIRDAIKRYRNNIQPPESMFRPFPTLNPELLNSLPREIWAKSTDFDPIDKQSADN